MTSVKLCTYQSTGIADTGSRRVGPRGEVLGFAELERKLGLSGSTLVLPRRLSVTSCRRGRTEDTHGQHVYWQRKKASEYCDEERSKDLVFSNSVTS